MKTLLCATVFLVCAAAAMTAGEAPKESPTATTLKFADVEYLHRWTKDDQHEFTPKGQEDLQKWTDMLTLHYYRPVKDGDTLANLANVLLENYKQHRGIVVRTTAVPRTPEKPAEYIIIVLLPQPEFIEAVFARLRITNGIGSAVIYSHREHGRQIGDQMSAWLQKNGPILEPALIAWAAFPAVDFAKNP